MDKGLGDQGDQRAIYVDTSSQRTGDSEPGAAERGFRESPAGAASGAAGTLC